MAKMKVVSPNGEELIASVTCVAPHEWSITVETKRGAYLYEEGPFYTRDEAKAWLRANYRVASRSKSGTKYDEHDATSRGWYVYVGGGSPLVYELTNDEIGYSRKLVCDVDTSRLGWGDSVNLDVVGFGYSDEDMQEIDDYSVEDMIFDALDEHYRGMITSCKAKASRRRVTSARDMQFPARDVQFRVRSVADGADYGTYTLTMSELASFFRRLADSYANDDGTFPIPKKWTLELEQVMDGVANRIAAFDDGEEEWQWMLDNGHDLTVFLNSDLEWAWEEYNGPTYIDSGRGFSSSEDAIADFKSKPGKGKFVDDGHPTYL